MRFGGLARISSAMLKSGQDQASRILDDVWARLEDAFSNISFEDNFKSRTVTLVVENQVNTIVASTRPNIVILKRFSPEDGSLVPVSWAWRPVPEGIEIVFSWDSTTRATIELFIEEK